MRRLACGRRRSRFKLTLRRHNRTAHCGGKGNGNPDFHHSLSCFRLFHSL